MPSRIPTEWIEYTIDELKDDTPSAIAIGPFGSRMKSDTYVQCGIPVIRGMNLSDTKALRSEFVYVSEETANQLATSNVYDGDLVFPHRGAIGDVGIVTGSDSARYILSTSLMKLSCNRSIAEPLFLFYFFRSRLGRHELLKNASQVGTPGIATPLTSLKSIRLSLPPLPEQCAIAHFLGTLDDKIELNRRMNQTLEEIARAIFKSWFIDFDPVRAKAAGRQPAGMDAGTAALFPSEFADSELGEIPQGWGVRSLDEIAHYRNGLALQKYPPGEDDWLPVIKIAQLHKGNADGADRASATLDSDYIVEDGDVLFSWSGSLEVVIWCGGRGALNQHLFKITSAENPKWFYYLWTKHYLDQFRAIAAGKATTMGHIQRQHLSDAEALVPPHYLMNAMSEIMDPLIDDVITSSIESRTLAAIRDALLPKLLSGELRVADCEVAV